MYASITIDKAIEKLEAVKRESKLGGGTCLVLSLSGSGIETVPVDDIVHVPDQDGAVIEVRARLPEGYLGE